MKFVFALLKRPKRSFVLLFFVSLAAAGCSTLPRTDERSQSIGCIIPVRGQRCAIVSADPGFHSWKIDRSRTEPFVLGCRTGIHIIPACLPRWY